VAATALLRPVAAKFRLNAAEQLVRFDALAVRFVIRLLVRSSVEATAEALIVSPGPQTRETYFGPNFVATSYG
jgi:hypothetical protein